MVWLIRGRLRFGLAAVSAGRGGRWGRRRGSDDDGHADTVAGIPARAEPMFPQCHCTWSELHPGTAQRPVPRRRPTVETASAPCPDR